MVLKVRGCWIGFLCDKNKYIELSLRGGARERQRENYTFSYMLDIDKEKVDFLKCVAEQEGTSLTTVTDAAKDETGEQTKWDVSVITGVSEEEWLAYFINAKYVVTDSFHGMCFAILFINHL